MVLTRKWYCTVFCKNEQTERWDDLPVKAVETEIL
jgi:hypothetical protein